MFVPGKGTLLSKTASVIIIGILAATLVASSTIAIVFFVQDSHNIVCEGWLNQREFYGLPYNCKSVDSVDFPAVTNVTCSTTCICYSLDDAVCLGYPPNSTKSWRTLAGIILIVPVILSLVGIGYISQHIHLLRSDAEYSSA